MFTKTKTRLVYNDKVGDFVDKEDTEIDSDFVSSEGSGTESSSDMDNAKIPKYMKFYEADGPALVVKNLKSTEATLSKNSAYLYGQFNNW